MSQQQYSDEDLAYHEAGHTVAALLLGRTVTRVSIVRDDASRGVRVPSLRDDAEETAEATADKILILLAAGKVMLHRQILQAVWGGQYADEVDYVWTFVRRIRRKLEPGRQRRRYLLTTTGIGYWMPAADA